MPAGLVTAMSYLPRVWMNPLRSHTQLFQRNPHALHAAMLGGRSRQPVTERLLWRSTRTGHTAPSCSYIVQVIDPDAAREWLLGGVGSGKGYDCGLITLAPARSEGGLACRGSPAAGPAPCRGPRVLRSHASTSAGAREVGDRAGALAAIDEAVSHYRQLAEANPAAFLPNLAMSLNNQAVRRGEVGDRTGALVAIDEAVSHYRQLAEANPAAFLPNLAMSLNNQANRRGEVGDRNGALAAFVDCWTGFTPGPRAELMATRSRWRMRHTDPGRAADLDG